MNKTTISRIFDVLGALIISGLLLLCFACGGSSKKVDAPGDQFTPLEVFEMETKTPAASSTEQEKVEYFSPAGEKSYLTPEDFTLSGETGGVSLMSRGNISPLVGLEEEDCWEQSGQLYCRVVKQPCRIPAGETEQSTCWKIFRVSKVE